MYTLKNPNVKIIHQSYIVISRTLLLILRGLAEELEGLQKSADPFEETYKTILIPLWGVSLGLSEETRHTTHNHILISYQRIYQISGHSNTLLAHHEFRTRMHVHFFFSSNGTGFNETYVLVRKTDALQPEGRIETRRSNRDPKVELRSECPF